MADEPVEEPIPAEPKYKVPQPLNKSIKIVNADGTPNTYFIRWAQERQRGIQDSTTQGQAEVISGNNIESWAANRDIIAGVALDGGGNLSADVTIDHADSPVTPGSYTSANITVDAQGHVTAAANGSGGGSGGILPVVDGSIPPLFIQLEDGELVYTEIA